MKQTTLGNSDLRVSQIGLGLWPIAGMTSLDVNPSDSLQTILRAWNAGINFFDTAFCYGPNGESEIVLGTALKSMPNESVVVATKCGVHWDRQLARVNDASPNRLVFECETSLKRLDLEQIDLLYLHSPDRIRPIEESAQAMRQLQNAGKARWIGLSNASLSEIQTFHTHCPLTAIQPRYNMLQREIEVEIVPWCLNHQVSIVGYWPLMKGLLAGKIRRNHQFDPQDKRLTYPVFQPPRWDRAQNLLDELERIAVNANKSIAQLVVAWTVAQPGITATLCGAKRPWQIEETAASLSEPIAAGTIWEIEQAIARNPIES